MKDLRQLVDDGKSEAADAVVGIREDLDLAWQCAAKALRRLRNGDLVGARRWADRACDFEYRALGECECYGHFADALGDDADRDIKSCGYRAGEAIADHEGTVVSCRPTCECEGCVWVPGDTVRSVRGRGVVQEVTVDGRAWVWWEEGQTPEPRQWVWRTGRP